MSHLNNHTAATQRNNSCGWLPTPVSGAGAVSNHMDSEGRTLQFRISGRLYLLIQNISTSTSTFNAKKFVLRQVVMYYMYCIFSTNYYRRHTVKYWIYVDVITIIIARLSIAGNNEKTHSLLCFLFFCKIYSSVALIIE